MRLASFHLASCFGLITTHFFGQSQQVYCFIWGPYSQGRVGSSNVAWPLVVLCLVLGVFAGDGKECSGPASLSERVVVHPWCSGLWGVISVFFLFVF